MRQQDQACTVKLKDFRDPAEQAQRRSSAILFQICDMRSLYAEHRGQLSLSKLPGRPLLAEQGTERLLAWSFDFHP
jgi:hypothetical protein